MMGGSLATAGGLTFTGEGNGNFNAYNSKTGKLLWQFNAGAGCNSAPMTFTHGGEQFVAVACGGNFQISYPLGDALMVFGLPAQGQEVAASDGRQGPRVGSLCRPIPLGRIVATRWWWAALVGGGFLAGRRERGRAGAPLERAGRRRLADAGSRRRGWPTRTDFSPERGSGRPRARRAMRRGCGEAMTTLYRNGRFRFPYGANVYVSRVNDYYWWENHRPLPIWYAFWEVNTSLTRPTTESAR